MRTILFSAITAVAFIFAPAAHAESDAAPHAGAQLSPAQQELMQTRQEIIDLKEQIADIQQKTLEQHPELRQQQQDLSQLIAETAQEQGYNAQSHQQKLESLQQRYKSGKLTPEEQQQVAGEFRMERNTMLEAQQQVLQDEAVQKARSEFADALTSAMAETDPKSKELVAELQSLTQKFRQKLSTAMQGQGGGS